MAYYSTTITQPFVQQQKTLKQLTLFWIGFAVYTLGFVFTRPAGPYDPLFHAVQLAGLFLLVPPAFRLLKFDLESHYLQFVFLLLLLWQLSIIARGFVIEFSYIKTVLYDAWFGILIYFAPLALLFPAKLSFYKRLFTVIAVFDALSFLYILPSLPLLLGAGHTSLENLNIVEHFVKTLVVPNGFLLLTYSYHSPKRRLLAIGMTAVLLFFAIFNARRGLLFIGLTVVLFSLLLHILQSKRKFQLVLFSVLLLAFGIFEIREMFQQNNHLVFGYLAERLDEDTRSIVEEAFFSDMKTYDWIAGKGINGQYYCPYVDPSEQSSYRSVVETDFLQIILKGGLVHLVLLLLIMLPAIYRGLFQSKNLLSKAAAVWILLWIAYLYPTSVTTFTLHYLLVWICVGICYSKKIRCLPDSRVRKYFLEKAG